MAAADSRRIVLVFGLDDVWVTQAIAALSRHTRRLSVVRSRLDKPGAPLARFAALRLEHEILLAVETDVRKAEVVVNALRLAGAPPVFVVRSDLGSSLPAETGWREPTKFNRRAILARLRECRIALDNARDEITQAVKQGHPVAKAAEWIADNSYLVHTQVNDLRRHLPRDLSPGALGADESGAFRLAQDLALKTDFSINEDNIRTCLREAQTSRVLTIGELWAFPLFLRIVLIETLASLAGEVSRGQQLRDLAYLWANRLATSVRIGNDELNRILGQLELEPAAGESYFLMALAEQLQDEEIALGPAQHWITERSGLPLIELVRNEHTKEAARVVSTANAFGSLRTLAQLEFTKVFEEVSVVEAELRADPGGIYPRSDFQTRDRCRRVVETIARGSGLEERDVARRVTELAAQSADPHTRHVAYYLLAEGVTRVERETGARVPLRKRIRRGVAGYATAVYLAAIILLTTCFMALASVRAWERGVHLWPVVAVLAALASVTLSELSVQIVHALIVSLIPPEPLPKMDFRDGIPEAHTTLVVVPMMLTSLRSIHREIEKLEVRYLGNRNENLYYSLFSDFTDSPGQVDPADAELLQAAVDGINRLNAQYPGGRFLLFHRSRSWSESEQSWIGRERKRGKIEDLNAFLCGDRTLNILHAGQLPRPVCYVITVDADTRLPVDSARRLVETIAHPLNRVAIDPAARVRTRGYTIIQPRVSIALPAATATRFSRVFADATGTDPYCQTVSDAQQDLFLQTMFQGKAIYDVRAFHEILRDRFPPESILSHDLIEGAHAGVGLASDIEIFESLPADYGSFARRQERWLRGDWQIAPWLSRRVPVAGGVKAPTPLTFIDRWRILDNLRRSLVPVAALLLLLLGWLIPGAPGISSLVVGVAIAVPGFAPLLDRMARRLQGSVRGWQGAADDLTRAGVMIAFLPHQAWLSVESIVRVFYRRWFSHRKLLEWQTAESARVLARHHIDATFRQMLTISIISVALAFVLAIRHALAPGIAFVGLWVISPFLMRWLALPVRPLRAKLRQADALSLHRAARRTWRYFDDLVGEQSHWLPPDNSQMALRIEVAPRTSPTNIGLWFVAALAARDFGYLTTDEMCARCSRTMETLESLERYEGHLLNWYDTNTLRPLAPQYVSTVDSGNLVAAFWVFAQGCHDVLRAPLIGRGALRGLLDTLSVLKEACGRDRSAAVPLGSLRELLGGPWQGHELIVRLRMALIPVEKLCDAQRWYLAAGDERLYWASRLQRELAAWNETANRYLLWMETLASPPDSALQAVDPDLADLRRRVLRHAPSIQALAATAPGLMDSILSRRSASKASPEMASWLDRLSREYATAKANAAETAAKVQALRLAVERFAGGITLGLLYDRPRRLFGVGYAVGSPRVFTSHYDLLASECRLASLVAIAKGDVPAEHWYALSRPWVHEGRREGLLSWSGTMFEYLMPLLFTRTFANSLLERACSNAVTRQIEYGRRNGIPWGISESAYSAIDAHQIYQYRAFGVPDLALNPAVQNDLVVAPYATMLALPLVPVAAAANLDRLQSLGMAGSMGYYESIDFTRESQRGGARGAVIFSCMAHHQAMSLAALDNLFHRDILQRRFHADPRVRSVESLLYEGVPIYRMPMEEKRVRPEPSSAGLDEQAVDLLWNEETAACRVHLYGNGSYALMITSAGTGYSRWREFDLTRWRSDATLDPWGSYIYIRDLRTTEVWATTSKPFTKIQGESATRLSADRTEFRRRVSGLESVMSVTVSAEDDVELRRLRIANRTLRSRQVELTTYLELAMAPHGADKAHPAFAKMFIETERADEGVLLAHRRPRSPRDAPIWTGHALVGAAIEIQCETDRAKFLGRSNTPENPLALQTKMTGSTGTVLDPIFSLRCRIQLDAREQRELSFITVAGASREEVLKLIHKYTRDGAVARAFEMAWTRSQLDLRFLGVGPGTAYRYQALAGQLLYPDPKLRSQWERVARNRLGQQNLWAYGISGDLPILTVVISESTHLQLLREVLLAHSYWRMRGFRADLVVFNQELPGYDQPLHHQILRQVEAHASLSDMDKPGGVFVRDWHAISEDGHDLLFAASSLVLSGARGPLARQIAPVAEGPSLPEFIATGGYREEPSAPLPFLELPYFNGLGGFTRDGREYAIYLPPGVTTPSPWVNVMANSAFGAMVSESGVGFTWRGNSQTNRLTPWHNDPVSDPQSEIIYLRDEDTGAVWTPTPLPARENDAYRARHGQGYAVFEHNSHAIRQELTVFVPVAESGPGDPVKICHLRLRNDSSRRRRISVWWYVEWVVGARREDQQLHLQTLRDEDSGALLARQFWHPSWCGQLAFAASSPRAASWSGDRARFFGRGSMAKPGALNRTRLDNRLGAGADPGAALQLATTLERGQEAQFVFLLGQAEAASQMRDVVQRYSTPELADAALAATKKWWDATLGVLQVHTPVLSIDLLLNRWLLYQTLSCRYWGRSALYQSSGAFGFRDQLQDCLAFVYAAPQITRGHILAAAARQFVEGDVQHWWHPDTGAGVRTRCSDDLLWLPWAVAHYVRITGDRGILDETVPFLEGPVLTEAEQEAFFTPAASSRTAPLWEHCARAIENGWRPGPHGLPLIGSGDWNDGMNLVGAEGRGESVWMGWFICTVLESFAGIIECRPEGREFATAWRRRAEQLRTTVEDVAWDGEWYLRGFFDDGTPLGSHTSEEARIDSLPQSWAVISDGAGGARARTAMESAERFLVRERDRLVLLFDPPFDHTKPNPGYIMGYPPGVRENGGQYTHGALWMAMAWARMKDGNRAARLLQMMNPVELNRSPEDLTRYGGEPYVVAADVSSAVGHVGKCGWTWYTGSAGWMYRIWIEEVLGFRLRGDQLTIDPVIPDDWDGFELTYRYGATTYEITVHRHDSAEVVLEVEGERIAGPFVQLVDTGNGKRVRVGIPKPEAARRNSVPTPLD